MSDIALSVIIPTYNRSGYVRDCLRSLRACGVPGLEVIVSDDGSTDDTRQVVAATDPAAVYLWQPNTGTPSTARNRGFAASRGRYVTFLDCDDQLLPGAAGRAVGLLDRHPQADVLFADARVGGPADGYAKSWLATSGRDDLPRLPAAEPEPGFRVLDRRPFFRLMVERNQVFLGATVFRRRAVQEAGGFDPALRGAADWEMTLRAASRLTFGLMAEPMALYTFHQSNMTYDASHMVGEWADALRAALGRCAATPGERARLRERHRQELFRAGYVAYDAGDYPTARRRLRAALRAGYLRPAAAALCLTLELPDDAVRTLRRAKRSLTPA